MNHGLTDTDAMFSVRETPWHRLPQAQVLSGYPTAQQAKKIAHDWEPIQETLYRQVPVIRERVHEHTLYCHALDCPDHGKMEQYPDVEYVPVDGFVANVRSDNAATLGVVTNSYEPVNNSTMYEIAEAIEGEAKGQLMLETGGSLNGGAKVWLLLRLREPLVIKNDVHGAVLPYFALQNSHDGSKAFRGQATAVRVVCQNTAHMADLDSQQRGVEISFYHTVNVHERIEQARQALAGWRESVQNYRLQMEHLTTMRLDEQGVNTFVERFIPVPKIHTVTDRVIANVERSRTDLHNILESVTCEGIDRTAYGMVQASIEYMQWGRKARSEETRFRRSFLDRNRVITDAVELAMELAL